MARYEFPYMVHVYDTYCWGHSPEITNQNHIFKMTPKVCQWRLVRSETPYLEQGPCIPPSRFGPPRRSGLQLGVSLDLVTAWRICGRSTGNGSRFENYIRVWSGEDVKFKMSSYNRDVNDLSGFVVTIHLGLCEQCVQPWPNASACIITTNPSRTSLKP